MPTPPDPLAEGAPPPGLTAASLRRLCLGLIAAEQADLIRTGRMARRGQPGLRDLVAAAPDDLAIDEDGLGFDSLSRLGLILRVNRFFNLAETGIEDHLLVQPRLGAWVDLLGQHLAIMGGRTALTFDTSGSAGPPKRVRHPLPDLSAEITAHLAGPFADLAPGRRIVSLVPAQHIYGFLFTCLLPDRLGLPVLDLTAAGPTAVFRQTQPGDLIIGTPFNWQILAAAEQDFPADVAGVTSAGPAAPETWDLVRRGGLHRLTEVYGATETGGLGTRTGFDQPFTLLPHLRRQGSSICRPPAGALPVQDRLLWQAGDRFRLRGRRDDVVQVAGVNVSLGQVAAVLRGFPEVADAAVRAGSGRLKAYVVPRDPAADDGTLETLLADRIRHSLPAPARPVALTFGPAVPRSRMGKLCDWSTDGQTAPG